MPEAGGRDRLRRPVLSGGMTGISVSENPRAPNVRAKRADPIMSSVKPADAAAGAPSADAPGLVDRMMEAWRQKLRSSELWFITLATLIGVIAGAMTVGLQDAAHGIQALLYSLSMSERLSTQLSLRPIQLLILPAGGIALAVFTYIVRARRRALVDSVEANALHGGQMSMKDSLIISGQTHDLQRLRRLGRARGGLCADGLRASPPSSEAADVRRPDLRTLVGAGAGAGIAAAFGAPLAGAFYAFEIVMGAYTPSSDRAGRGGLARRRPHRPRARPPTPISSPPGGSGPIDVSHYLFLCRARRALRRARHRPDARDHRRRGAHQDASACRPTPSPRSAASCLMPLALCDARRCSPRAMARSISTSPAAPPTIGSLITVILAKCAASIVSLGFGFRGGLFFASLFVGSLFGQLYADTAVLHLRRARRLDAADRRARRHGRACCGGDRRAADHGDAWSGDPPRTSRSPASSSSARWSRARWCACFFGYSFSTWRLHLRGETIRSARDVGWVRTLTAGRMMRRETRATPAKLTVAEFRRRFPLGSTSRVVLVDDFDRYQASSSPRPPMPTASIRPRRSPTSRSSPTRRFARRWTSSR